MTDGFAYPTGSRRNSGSAADLAADRLVVTGADVCPVDACERHLDGRADTRRVAYVVGAGERIEVAVADGDGGVRCSADGRCGRVGAARARGAARVVTGKCLG